MRTNIYLIIVLSTICFSSCYREKGFEVFPECRRQEPNRAGKKYWNIIRIVVPKYDAACFLIKNMPGILFVCKKFRSGQFEKNTIRHIP